jgi:hypothetical protein
MENSDFLKKKYELHKAPEVERAAKRTEARTGEKVPQKSEARIQNYLDRLESLVLDPEKKQPRKDFDGEARPRALLLLREMLMNKYIRPHKEKMAEGAARVEERIAREMGIAAEYNEEALEERGEIAVEDLEKSLDNWISYLSNANEQYPAWFRYYAFRNILDLGDYDKEKEEFTKRSRGSTRLFPEIDRGALAYVQQIMEASKSPSELEKLQKAQKHAGTPPDQLITKEKAANFANLSFAKQYAEGIKQSGEITAEMKEETEGKWIKYQQNTDPTALWSSLQNKGTAWCTRGFATAESQLKGGDFYAYYTYDRQGKPIIPRIAIRMQGSNIGEVRGVADNDQNLEGNMLDIAEKKMNELSGANQYRKASSDMKRLTEIEKKTKANEKFTKEDILFLYEINGTIKGFGYQRDPRIKELAAGRDLKEDLSYALGVPKDKISTTRKEVLSGDIIFHYGNLDLSSLTSAEGLKLPESVGGSLNLNSLTSAEGLKLPESVGGDLYLNSLTSAEGLKLPESVGGSLDLSNLTSAEGLKLPESVGRYLYLSNLTSAEGLKLPESVGGYLYLSNLTSVKKDKLRKKYPHLSLKIN